MKVSKTFMEKRRVVPNMHMHAHILDCIIDYGPVYFSGYLALSDIMVSWEIL